MAKTSQFDATSSALGYIYQVRYGLLSAIKKLTQVDDPDDFFASIERLDDIAFEQGDDPHELLQTKFHGTPGNLTDRSPDLWKTIRVWCESIKSKQVQLGKVFFTLITTQKLNTGSIAVALCEVGEDRDIDFALTEMRKIAIAGGSNTNNDAYLSFMSLKEWEQKQLLESVFVLGESKDILGIRGLIKNQLRISVEKTHVEAFLMRLEGAWFTRVIEILSFNNENSICLGELQAIMDDLRNEFRPTNLPADFTDVTHDNIDIGSDTRLFIEQLRLINASESALRLASLNYYRAYEQKSRWSKDGLLRPSELKKYERRLQEEWDTFQSLESFNYNLDDELQKKAFGGKVYRRCQIEGALPIRPDFKEAYVARGSYHELADDKVIGWHPEYLTLVRVDDESGVA